jgi:hypothetical protein
MPVPSPVKSGGGTAEYKVHELFQSISTYFLLKPGSCSLNIETELIYLVWAIEHDGGEDALMVISVPADIWYLAIM